MHRSIHFPLGLRVGPFLAILFIAATVLGVVANPARAQNQPAGPAAPAAQPITPAAAQQVEASRSELLRVVNPLGKVLLAGQEIRKPYPAEADDWTHATRPVVGSPSGSSMTRTGCSSSGWVLPLRAPLPTTPSMARGGRGPTLTRP